MIAFLKGRIQDLDEDIVILNVNGVGYEVYSSSKTRKDLFISKEVELWIYTHVKEDSFKLFGFSHKLEKKIFPTSAQRYVLKKYFDVF